jgi:nickel-type superoxide dismutase maturation protease
LAFAAFAGATWLARTFRRVEVVGDSMRPTLQPGDRILLRRTADIVEGDMVALDDPRQPARLVIKRVAACSPDSVTVLGDNPTASTDSRSFGAVARSALRGRAVYRYFPSGRRARLGR